MKLILQIAVGILLACAVLAVVGGFVYQRVERRAEQQRQQAVIDAQRFELRLDEMCSKWLDDIELMCRTAEIARVACEANPQLVYDCRKAETARAEFEATVQRR